MKGKIKEGKKRRRRNDASQPYRFGSRSVPRRPFPFNFAELVSPRKAWSQITPLCIHTPNLVNVCVSCCTVPEFDEKRDEQFSAGSTPRFAGTTNWQAIFDGM
jgi:hypothetical protein